MENWWTVGGELGTLGGERLDSWWRKSGLLVENNLIGGLLVGNWWTLGGERVDSWWRKGGMLVEKWWIVVGELVDS